MSFGTMRCSKQSLSMRLSNGFQTDAQRNAYSYLPSLTVRVGLVQPWSEKALFAFSEKATPTQLAPGVDCVFQVWVDSFTLYYGGLKHVQSGSHDGARRQRRGTCLS